MSTSESPDQAQVDTPPPARRLVDLAPLKASPAFARLWIGGAISGIGAFMTAVAVGLLIYDITESTFAVGLVGGISLVPMIIAGLWGGVIADVADRRRVLIVTSLISWTSTLTLVVLSIWEEVIAADGRHIALWPLYLVTTINAVTTPIGSAARGAVVGDDLFPDRQDHEREGRGPRDERCHDQHAPAVGDVGDHTAPQASDDHGHERDAAHQAHGEG